MVFSTESHSRSIIDDSITYADIFQVGRSYKANVIRAIISGIDSEDIKFDFPNSENFKKNPKNQFFHNEYGGGTYLDLSDKNRKNLFNDGSPIIITQNYNVSNYKTTLNTEKNDIILIIRNVLEEQCLAAAKGNKLDQIPKLNITPNDKDNDEILSIDIQGFKNGCFKAPDNNNYYLQIMLER